MAFQWNRQTIEWYKQATNDSKFHICLAQLLLPYIEYQDVIGEFGCGIGTLSVQLSPYVKKIVAIDTNELAIETLSNTISEYGIYNIFPYQIPYEKYNDEEKFDHLLMCFFGNIRTKEQLEYFLSFCKKKLFYIVSAFSKEERVCSKIPVKSRVYADEFLQLLEEQNLSYEYINTTLEFGQPFQNEGEIEQFINYYYRDCIEEKEIFYERVIKREDGSFYLPKQKQIGIFVVEK